MRSTILAIIMAVLTLTVAGCAAEAGVGGGRGLEAGFEIGR